jgi:hypothetical protein
VVCADTLLDHIPPELEDYESAMLWKSLRNLCSRGVFHSDVQGHAVRVLAPPIRQPHGGVKHPIDHDKRLAPHSTSRA